MSLQFLNNAQTQVEKQYAAAKGRQTHLKLQKRFDRDTEELVEKLADLDRFIDGKIAVYMRTHPAAPWFYRIRGVGDESIGKIIGVIRIKPAEELVCSARDCRMHILRGTADKCLECGSALIDPPYADTPSAIWAYAGLDVDLNGKAPKRIAGQKLTYNSRLRSVCWRLATSMLRTSIRHTCTHCGAKASAADAESKGCCGAHDFKLTADSKYAQYFLDQKDAEYKKLLARGWKIIPALDLPKKDGKRYEPEGVISEGHVHNRAVRKMIKLFLSHLFVVWRQAEGLPVRPCYAEAVLGHDGIIDPWSMVDDPVPAAEPKRRGRKKAN